MPRSISSPEAHVLQNSGHASSASPVALDDPSRAFFELAPVGAAQIDVATRRLLRANRRFAAMTGFTERELAELTLADLTPAGGPDRALPAFEDALQRKVDDFSFEQPLRRKEGGSLWVAVSGTILRDSSHRPARIVVVVQDITARRQTEDALRATEQQTALVLDALPVAVLHLDAALRVRFANRIYLQRRRQTAESVNGTFIRDIVGPGNFAILAPYLDRALAGFDLEFEVRLRFPLIGERELHIRYTPERRDGAVQGIVAAIEDITERKQTEAGLRRSEQQLAAIFASAAAGLCEISLEGRFERVNDELCRMLGRPPEQLLDLTVLEVTHPDDVVRSLRSIGELVQNGGCVSLDKRYRRPDGRIVWANSRLTRLDDKQGRPQAVLAVTVDLTARREAERALAESESKFRTLAGASPAVIWFVDADGDTRYVNDRYLEFFGKTEAQVLGHDWQPPVHPDDLTSYVTELNAGLRERRPLSLRVRFRRHDDAWRWIESQALPHFGEDGRYLGHVGHSLDITELVETTDALRRSEERLRRATEIEAIGIAFFTPLGRVTQTNAAYLRMTGFTADEVAAGELWLDRLATREERPTVARALEELNSLGHTHPYEKHSLRRDGSHWWSFHAAARLAPDECVEFVIDITTRKQNEEELRGYQEELEERVLHRTAELDGLNGMLRDEILERKRAEQSRQDLLRRLVTAQEEERRRISRELHDQVGQDLTALMLGLKALHPSGDAPSPADLQRLQTLTEGIGKQIHDMALEIRPTALDDHGLLRTLSNYVDDWSKRAGIEIDFHSSGWQGERLPSHVETTLYRIVREALNNVVKHAAATRVSLIIERQPDQAVAIVEDNGRGFDPEQFAHGSGNRLGIVGMRERASLAGGELSVESSPGGGTTVFVRVPIRVSTPSPHHV